jgi:O-antigen ligase
MSSLGFGVLWMFVFCVPWEGLIASGGVALLTRVTGGAALGLALLSTLVNGRIRRWRMFHLAVLLFILWVGGGVLLFHNNVDVPKKFYTFIQLLLVVWMIWELTPTRQRVLALLMAYVLGAYVSAIATILLYRREASSLQRFAAGGNDPNDLAMTLALGIPMAWYLSMNYHRPLLRWICRAYFPIGLLAIALSGSRGGLVASLVALMIVPLSMTNLSPGKLAAGISMLAVSGFLAATYVPETIVERLATTGQTVEDRSLGGRFRLWVVGFEAFLQRPLLGYGISSFKPVAARRLGTTSQVAHNSYLSVLVELGLLGLVLFCWILFSVFMVILPLPPPDRRFGLVLLVTLLVVLLPLTWEDRKPVWIILSALVSFACAGRVQETARAWQQRRVRNAPLRTPAAAALGRSRPMPSP